MPRYKVELRSIYDDESEFGVFPAEKGGIVEANSAAHAVFAANAADQTNVWHGEEYRVTEINEGPVKVFRPQMPVLEDVTPA